MSPVAEQCRALLLELAAPVVTYTGRYAAGSHKNWRRRRATKRDVADRLRMLGCKGSPGCACGCPVAQYLWRHRIGTVEVFPGEGIVELDNGETVSMPTPIDMFACHFDAANHEPTRGERPFCPDLVRQ